MTLNVELLEQSFEQIKPQAQEFISSFYNTLFFDYPAAQPLFAHTNMATQEQMLLSALVFTVENLRHPVVLADALKGLGTRHVEYGALPEHYPLVGMTLLKTFQQYLGAMWTADIEQAWVDAYDAIAQLMLDGANYSAETINLKQR